MAALILCGFISALFLYGLSGHRPNLKGVNPKPKGAEMKFDTTDLESYITDKTLESEIGIWVAFPGDRKFRTLRAGGSNKKFSRALNAALRPYRKAFERGTMDDEIADAITREVYCKHVIVDWKGIKDGDGVEIPYSPEVAIEFFTMFPDLFSDLVTISLDMATFSKERIEEAKKIMGEV